MNLSKYCEINEKSWNSIEKTNAQKLVKYLNENTDVDLYKVAKKRNELEVFKNLNVWLYNFYNKEFLEGLNYINFDHKKYEKNLIYSFILSVTRSRSNIDLLYDVLVSKGVIEKMLVYENSIYEILTKDFGNIQFKKASDEEFFYDTQMQKYLSSLGNNIVDGCHEISFFLIKKYDRFKAVTSICNKGLNCNYYHSFIINENEDVIDLTANLVMPKAEYYLLQDVRELNVVSYGQYLLEKDSSINFDESKTLFDLLRNALYKQYMCDKKEE